MDLVDEEDVTLLHVGEQAGEVSRAFSMTRAGRDADVATEFEWPRMRASVVLPRPGGPESRMWLSASPRRLAAPTMTFRRSTVLGCPAKSANESGRSADSELETGAVSAPQ